MIDDFWWYVQDTYSGCEIRVDYERSKNEVEETMRRV